MYTFSTYALIAQHEHELTTHCVLKEHLQGIEPLYMAAVNLSVQIDQLADAISDVLTLPSDMPKELQKALRDVAEYDTVLQKVVSLLRTIDSALKPSTLEDLIAASEAAGPAPASNNKTFAVAS